MKTRDNFADQICILKNTGTEKVEKIQLARDRFQWQDFVNTAMGLRVSDFEGFGEHGAD
jgi:hypothetical protein